jgi:hypothetical protein
MNIILNIKVFIENMNSKVLSQAKFETEIIQDPNSLRHIQNSRNQSLGKIGQHT